MWRFRAGSELGEAIANCTFACAKFSSQSEEPLVLLLQPVVYFVEDVRLTCKAFFELLEIEETIAFKRVATVLRIVYYCL